MRSEFALMTSANDSRRTRRMISVKATGDKGICSTYRYIDKCPAIAIICNQRKSNVYGLSRDSATCTQILKDGFIRMVLVFFFFFFMDLCRECTK